MAANQNISIDRLFATDVVTEVVSRVAENFSPLGREMGILPGGANERIGGNGNILKYDIFNNTRNVPPDTGASAPAVTVRRQVVGSVYGVMPRSFFTLRLPLGEIYRMRPVGGGTVDVMGQQYVALQEKYLAQLVANRRILLAMGCVRGKIYRHGNDVNGYYWDFTSTNANATIVFNQFETENFGQLPMDGSNNIITGSWASPSTNIPEQITKIDAQFTINTGSRLSTIVVNDTTWQYVINNDYVAAQAGIANSPFTVFERANGTGPDGRPVTLKVGRLTCLPWVEWYITNEGVNVGQAESGTYTKFIEDNKAFFCGSLSDGANFAYLKGDEPIIERDGERPQQKVGMSSWVNLNANPSVYDMFTLDLGTPVMYMPQSVAYGTVAGF